MPRVKTVVNDTMVLAAWQPAKDASTRQFVVYMRYGNKWQYTILPGRETSYPIQRNPQKNAAESLTEAWVSAISHTGIESERVKLKW
jgi:hypothetical protein